MKKVGVYILRCFNGRYYVGSTQDLARRLSQHDEGLVRSTKNVLPVELVYFKECNDPSQAKQLEYKIKKKKSRVIIDKIVKDGYIKFLGP